MSKDKVDKKTKNIGDEIKETVKTVVYALLLAGIIRTLFFQPFFIPSGSMKSTLLIGDFLFVNKMSYGYSKYSCPFSMCPFSGRILGSEPERGDIIVFRHTHKSDDLIKRLIGLPGDRIQMRKGLLYINDTLAPQKTDGVFEETYDAQGIFGNVPACSNPVSQKGDVCKKERSIETLPNGVEHIVLNIRTQSSDDTPVFTVPDGHYFFMGDNRDNSGDSRMIGPNALGFVPYENLIGKANHVFLSSAGKRILYFWTWRTDRFWKKLQ